MKPLAAAKHRRAWQASGAIPGTLCVAIIIAASSARATHPRLAEASELVRRNEPAAAADVYRDLLREGVDGLGLRYNLGTLALDEGKVGEAVLHLRTAQRMSPLDEDVRHNLGVALEARVDRLAGDPVDSPVGALGSAVPPRLARLALAVPLALLGVALALLGVLPMRARRRLRPVVAGLALASVCGAVIFAARTLRERTREAVVMVDAAAAQREPAPRAPEAFVAHAGLLGDVVDESGEFVRVRFENGVEAWLRIGDVGLIGGG